MHTYLYRLNAVFTVATTVLGGLCALAALTDLLHVSEPQVSATLESIDGLTKDNTGDRAWMTISLDADLQRVFGWNTKQAFVYVYLEYGGRQNCVNEAVVWSRIVVQADQAKLHESIRLEYPYAITAQGHEFRGMPFNITVAYETVPKVGAMWRRSFTFGGHQMPADYFMSNAVPRSGWVH